MIAQFYALFMTDFVNWVKLLIAGNLLEYNKIGLASGA